MEGLAVQMNNTSKSSGEQASLLIMSGPAGAGKSEFAELWGESRTSPCARVSPDAIWDLIKSGHVYTDEGWTDEVDRQHEITLDGSAGLVSNFLRNQISVVMDEVVFPAWPKSGLEAWERRLPGVELNMVVLMPSWEVIVNRNAQRSGRDDLPEPMLRKIYDDMQGWREQSKYPVIDNDKLTVEETVAMVETILG